MRPLKLPGPLQARVEALALDLLRPEEAGIDFSQPPGEPALVPADSISWRVFANPVTMFVGGVAAVLLELAEPRVRHGVWDHSRFRERPMERLRRTGLAAMVTVYGPAGATRKMIEGVNRAHARVAGVTSGGIPYRADDPELLDWVQATAAFGFLEGWAAYARPVAIPDRDLYFAEGAPVAALYGAAGAPRSQAEWEALLARMRPRLEPSATIAEFLRIMRDVPAFPRAGRPAQRMLVRAAVDILPGGVAERLELGGGGLRPWERPLVAALAKAADRLMLKRAPPVQSCRRLGLPDDWLYR